MTYQNNEVTEKQTPASATPKHNPNYEVTLGAASSPVAIRSSRKRTLPDTSDPPSFERPSKKIRMDIPIAAPKAKRFMPPRCHLFQMALRSAALDAPPQTPQQLPFHPNNGDFEVKLSSAPSATVPGAIAFGNKRRSHAEMTAGDRVVVDNNRVKRLKVIPLASPPAPSHQRAREHSHSDSPSSLRPVKRLRVKPLHEGSPAAPGRAKDTDSGTVGAAPSLLPQTESAPSRLAKSDSEATLGASSSPAAIGISKKRALPETPSSSLQRPSKKTRIEAQSATLQKKAAAKKYQRLPKAVKKYRQRPNAARWIQDSYIDMTGASTESSQVVMEDAPLMAADLLDAAQVLDIAEILLCLAGCSAAAVELEVPPSNATASKPKAKRARKKVTANPDIIPRCGTRSRSPPIVATVPRRVTRSMTKKAL